MLKFFTSKKFIKKVAIVLLILTLFNFIGPQPVQAKGIDWDKFGGVLLSPLVALFTALGDVCMMRYAVSIYE